MTVHWLFTGAALLLAAVALARARWAAKRSERLAESYWELRYEYGQLRARLARLEGQPDDDTPQSPAAGRDVPAQFIPLSTLKR